MIWIVIISLVVVWSEVTSRVIVEYVLVFIHVQFDAYMCERAGVFSTVFAGLQAAVVVSPSNDPSISFSQLCFIQHPVLVLSLALSPSLLLPFLPTTLIIL